MEKITTFVESQMKDHWQAMENMPMDKVVNHSNSKINIVVSDYVNEIRTEMLNRINENEDIPQEAKSKILKEFDALFESI